MDKSKIIEIAREKINNTVFHNELQTLIIPVQKELNPVSSNEVLPSENERTHYEVKFEKVKNNWVLRSIDGVEVEVLKDPLKIDYELADAVENMVYRFKGDRDSVKIAICKKTAYKLAEALIAVGGGNILRYRDGFNPFNGLVGETFRGVAFVQGYDEKIVVFADCFNGHLVEPIKIDINE